MKSFLLAILLGIIVWGGSSVVSSAHQKNAGQQPTTPKTVTSADKKDSESEKLITAEALLEKMKKGEKLLILDVRTLGQYRSSSSHIKGDMRLEEAEIDTKLKDVPLDQQIVTYCT